ncbi:hypothetical protein QJS10_CPB14g00913 [Acorus calamus]|uniref:HAT C-terminal dimerisation domain-containing protein n=1 Tax=Acorus calamus TaxID=4465 RepID=A0AAV9DEE1_ACOCL|nr:hypothetical protein QJS10_CPB14g00913 [Acorus calamus]
MAHDILSVPATTVASESAFSAGGRVLDQYCNSLKPEIVKAFIYAGDWLCTDFGLVESSNEECMQVVIEGGETATKLLIPLLARKITLMAGKEKMAMEGEGKLKPIKVVGKPLQSQWIGNGQGWPANKQEGPGLARLPGPDGSALGFGPTGGPTGPDFKYLIYFDFFIGNTGVPNPEGRSFSK